MGERKFAQDHESSGDVAWLLGKLFCAGELCGHTTEADSKLRLGSDPEELIPAGVEMQVEVLRRV
jgi:hypothetical protein